MKRIIGLFLALIMLLGMMGTAYAAEGDEVNFVVSSGEGRPGDEVQITISLKENPGVALAAFDVVYDQNALEWTGGTVTEDTQNSDYSCDATPGYKILWQCWNQDLMYDDVVMCTLTFKVKGTANPGDYEINLNITPGDVYDFNEEDIAVNIEKGKVTVLPAPDGYYLVGTMNDWTPIAAYKFEENSGHAGEYMLETGLTVGDEIKVVGVFNGVKIWYPSDKPNYTVESQYAGRKTVYFNPDYQSGWDHFGGHIWIADALTAGAEIYGCSLSLKGDVALNFFVYLPDELLADTEAYVTLTVNEGTKDEKVNTILVSSAKTRTVDGKVLRLFTVNLRPKQMNDEVVLRVYTGAGETYNLYNHNTGEVVTDGYAYTIHTYVEKVHQNSSDDTNLVNLVDAMYDYGVLAQKNSKYHVSGLPDVQANLDEVTAETVAEYAPVITPETAEGVNYKGLTLVLDTETVLRVYFDVADGVDISEYTFKVDGKTCTPQEKDGVYYVEIANIAARNLNKVYTVTVTKGDETVQTVKACALSYAVSVLNDPSTTTSAKNLKNLVKGLYLYNKAAIDYFG